MLELQLICFLLLLYSLFRFKCCEDCENIFGEEHSTENYEFPNGLSHCGEDLCNAKFNSFEFDDEGNLYTNNSYYLNYSLFVYVFAVVITIFTISF